jgi:putative endonuclease
MYYAYIIQSLRFDIFYKGSTSDYKRRLVEHNGDKNEYTRGKGPWVLIFVREFETKRQALIQEKKLKRCNKDYLR